jgi:hypothetical protein
MKKILFYLLTGVFSVNIEDKLNLANHQSNKVND